MSCMPPCPRRCSGHVVSFTTGCGFAARGTTICLFAVSETLSPSYPISSYPVMSCPNPIISYPVLYIISLRAILHIILVCQLVVLELYTYLKHGIYVINMCLHDIISFEHMLTCTYGQRLNGSTLLQGMGLTFDLSSAVTASEPRIMMMMMMAMISRGVIIV